MPIFYNNKGNQCLQIKVKSTAQCFMNSQCTKWKTDQWSHPICSTDGKKQVITEIAWNKKRNVHVPCQIPKLSLEIDLSVIGNCGNWEVKL